MKKPQYNVRNCKSGSYNQRHTFGLHNSQCKPSLTNIPNYGFKVKERKNRKTKTSFPCHRNRMLCALNLCQDVGTNHLSTDSGYDNYSCINLDMLGFNAVDSYNFTESFYSKRFLRINYC